MDGGLLRRLSLSNYILLININLERGKAGKLRCRRESTETKDTFNANLIRISRIITLISPKAQIYALLKQIIKSWRSFEMPICRWLEGKMVRHCRSNWMFYIFPSLGDRSNKSRAFPTPSSCASTSSSDFIPREKWSNKITESTRQQQTPLNQRSVPPALSTALPSHPTLPLISLTPARTLSSSSRVSTKSFSVFPGHPVI